MKKTILIGFGFILLFGACEMPGVGEVAEQVEGQVEDISEEIEAVANNMKSSLKDLMLFKSKSIRV